MEQQQLSPHVQYAQLAAAKQAIKLEQKGLKHSRLNVRRVWAIHLGLKPSAKHEVVIAEIEKRMEELLAQRSKES